MLSGYKDGYWWGAERCLAVRPLLFSPLAATDDNIVSVISWSQGDYISVRLVTTSKLLLSF